MSEIFREVDEAVRQEEWQALWKRYGGLAIGAVLLVVLATAGFTGWNWYQDQQRRAAGSQFSAGLAMLAENRSDDAAALFGSLAQDGRAGYAALARLREAQALSDIGDDRGAIAVYDRLAADRSASREYRELASLFAAMRLMDVGDAADAEQRLAPLADGDGAWRFLARELLGHLAHARGDIAGARAIFAALADDAAAPIGNRERAAELLQSLEAGTG